MKRLIDLEGIAAIERGMNLPNRHWAPENDDLQDRIDRYSLQHFGRLQANTEFVHVDRFWDHYDDADPYDDEVGDEIDADRQFVYDELNRETAWDDNFVVLDLPFEQQAVLWNALGWDVTDGAGKPLTCLVEFNRQLLAFAKGLPLQGKVEALEEVKAEDWGAALAAEARKFGNGRR